MSAAHRPLGLKTVCFLEDLSLKKVCASSSWGWTHVFKPNLILSFCSATNTITILLLVYLLLDSTQ
ncbi:hypothetical protein HanIR_Chr16g0833431 [Helianthus annuus]|nr:hypothetical protein HanIR_Chr16g0833431 [Helianthus annuus]